MDLVLLMTRLLLAAVFLLAGTAKLADQRGSRQAVLDFGLPRGLAPILGLAVPIFELLVGLFLIPVSTARVGAIGALVLLGGFIIGIAYNLTRGRRPKCHCFGQLHSQPAGWTTLARNLVLAAMATFLVASTANTGISVFAWIERFPRGQVVLVAIVSTASVVIAGQAWFLAQLFVQHGRVLVRLDRLEARLTPGAAAVAPPPSAPPVQQPQGLLVGAPAPAFALPTVAGPRVSLQDLLDGDLSVLLLFVDPNCGPCTALLPDLVRWSKEYAGVFSTAIVSRGVANENRKKFAATGGANILLQQKYEVSERYSALATPSAVLIRSDGRIGSLVAAGSEAIQTLVARAGSHRKETPTQNGSGNTAGPVGTLAPAIILPDLDGQPVELASYIGRETLVLLWNPSCGFCQRMLPDLKAWEEAATPGAPQLLVVSTGGRDSNRSMGLRSTVVLDDSFAAGRAFGAGGTPSAVLLDAGGRMASEVAVGAQAVFALAAPLEVLPRLDRIAR